MPKVSVIIPNYNHVPYLTNRIESVLNQTYQDFEVILLDDCSTDSSIDIINHFSSHPKIRVYKNETNSGNTFKQWNKGIKLANGEYIWIAESDDVADDRFLETLVPELERHSNVGLAFCNSNQIGSDGVLLKNPIYFPGFEKERWESSYKNSGKVECKKYLLHQNMIPNASAVLFRKHLYETYVNENESMQLCGDWFTWVQILLHSDISYCSQKLNYYRFHDSTVRFASSKQLFSFYEIYRIVHLIQTELKLTRNESEEKYWNLSHQLALFLELNKVKWNSFFTQILLIRRIDRRVFYRLVYQKYLLKSKVYSRLKKLIKGH